MHLSREHPFAGLRPFEFSDREFFFGRQSQIYALYRLLDRSRFVAVIGSSGSGKSSLVRAGLLPLLETSWERITLQPGIAPLSALTDAIADFAARTEAPDARGDADVRRELIDFAVRESSFALSNALARVPASAGKKILVVVDQFEELFRYAGPASRNEATQFVQILLEGSRAREHDVRILITMRSDFIGDCAQFQNLPEAVSASQFLVPSLTRDQREEVIRLPIARADATISPDLVERLLNDVSYELDQLPVLQHCLLRMWDHARARSHEPTTILESDYRDIGRIDGAISQHADDVLLELPGLEPVVEQVFRALSERDNEGRAVRRPLPFRQLVDETGMPPAEVCCVVDRFRGADCSFLLPAPLTVPELRDDTRIDVVHEALLRRWTRITGAAPQHGWLDDEDADGRYYRSLLSRIDGGETTLPIDRVEERYEWWTSRPRTAAWAERYGGRRDRVQQFFDDSLAALKADKDAKEAQQRQREEAIRKVAARTAFAAAVTILAIIAGIAGGAYFVSKLRREEVSLSREGMALAAAHDQLSVGQGKLIEGKLALRRAQYALMRGHRDLNIAQRQLQLSAVQLQRKNLEAQQEREKAAGALKAAIAQRKRADKQQSLATVELGNLLAVRSRDLARDAQAAVDRGDAVTGMLLALTSLPQSLARPDRPLVPEAEAALEHAVFSQRETRDLRGHKAPITSAEFSRDGARIVSASLDGTARLWSAQSGAAIAVLTHDGPVRSAVFSPDGSRIVTASIDKTARLWDGKTGALVAILKNGGPVNSAVFSPDNTRVLTASDDYTARVWDAKTGAVILTMKHRSTVHSAAFSPDGRLIVTASYDKTARIWDANTGIQIAALPHDDAVSLARFSPDGKHIITSSGAVFRIWDWKSGTKIALPRGCTPYSAAFSPDGTRVVTSSPCDAVIWDATNGKRLVTLRQDAGAVFTVEYSPDGTRIATASTDGTARIFDATKGDQIAVLAGHEGWVRSAAFSSNGEYVVTAGNDATARIWNVAPQWLAVMRGHSGLVNFAAFSPDGTRIVTTSADRSARLWDGNGVPIAVLPHDNAVTSAAFSPDSKLVVTCSADGTAGLWNARTGARIGILRHRGPVKSATFSLDGTRIVTASADKTARLWNAATGAQIAVLPHDRGVNSAVFSPDGMRVLTASDDGTARLWNARSGGKITTLKKYAVAVEAGAFSPDGNRVVLGLLDWTARLLDANSRREMAVLRGHESSVVYVAFSPDGARIVTASTDNTARLWNGQTGAPIGTMGTVISAAFSPDGSRVVTGAFFGPVQLWDVKTGWLIGALRGHTSNVLYAAFSPDGARLVSASADKTARLWDVSAGMLNGQALIDHANHMLPRQLTAEQRRQEGIAPRSSASSVTSAASHDTLLPSSP